MWGGAVPQRCCFNLLFSFGWKEDWQSRSICSRSSKRFLVFTNFHPGGKAAAELNEKRLWDGGCCLPRPASSWYGGCRMKSSECQDAHWLFPNFFCQHVWNAIPSKPRFKMESFAFQSLSGRIWNIATTNLWQSCNFFFLKYANILHKMASILTFSCQKVLQIIRTVADVGVLENLFSKTPNCQPVNIF